VRSPSAIRNAPPASPSIKRIAAIKGREGKERTGDRVPSVRAGRVAKEPPILGETGGSYRTAV